MESEYFITSSVYVFGNRRVPPAMPSPDGDAGQELNAYALFGEAYYQVTDDLRLTLGGRWTQEEKDFILFSNGFQAMPRAVCRASVEGDAKAADASGILRSSCGSDPYRPGIRRSPQFERQQDLQFQWQAVGRNSHLASSAGLLDPS